MKDENVPHWERGYRTHGYWLNNRRIGYVGLSPRLPGQALTYTWQCDLNYTSGKTTSLHQAKQRVEIEVANFRASADIVSPLSPDFI